MHQWIRSCFLLWDFFVAYERSRNSLLAAQAAYSEIMCLWNASTRRCYSCKISELRRWGKQGFWNAYVLGIAHTLIPKAKSCFRCGSPALHSQGT